MNADVHATHPRHAVEVVPDAPSIATRGAEWLIEQIAHAIAKRGRAAVALSGGTTPRALYAHLAEHPWRDRIQWDLLHLFWSDERFVPHDDAASNLHMVRETLLDHVPIPAANVHAIPYLGSTADRASASAFARAGEAAAAYAKTLATFYGSDTLDDANPLFDVVLLGLGEDGHTASLFPGSPALDERSVWVAAITTGDKPPPVRITLTYPALESTHAVAFLVSGAAKRDIAARVLAGNESLPAARLRPHGGMLWIMDEESAGTKRRI